MALQRLTNRQSIFYQTKDTHVFDIRSDQNMPSDNPVTSQFSLQYITLARGSHTRVHSEHSIHTYVYVNVVISSCTTRLYSNWTTKSGKLLHGSQRACVKAIEIIYHTVVCNALNSNILIYITRHSRSQLKIHRNDIAVESIYHNGLQILKYWIFSEILSLITGRRATARKLRFIYRQIRTVTIYIFPWKINGIVKSTWILNLLESVV